MRRTVASVAALVLVSAASASAASRTYDGVIAGDAKASVTLEVEIRGDRRVVTEFTVRRFPLVCEDGTAARLDRARLAGRARVSGKGRFELAASNATQRLRVEGTLGRKKASGGIRYSGLTEFEDRTLDCHTDGLRWTASR